MSERIGRRIALLTVAGIVAALVGGELFARGYLGLGTPPLSVAHPTIEYLFKPDQDVHRFGNHIVINHFGMRSFPFASREAGELRIMIFGDSVLNGGNLTDHAALATTILERRLGEKTGRKVVVGNVSAGSWGPGNWLAYAEEYGFFDADAVVLVASSHDYADNPTFQPLDPETHPTHPPMSALLEGVTRYLPRYLPAWSNGAAEQGEVVTDAEVEKALEALKQFLEMAKSSTARVLVFQHWERGELARGEASQGNARIREVSEALGIVTIQLMPYFQVALDGGENPYRDDIHPNDVGQAALAKALLENLPDATVQR